MSQTHKLDRRIVILLYGSTYWKEIINFEALVRHGTISREDLALFRFVDNPAAALRVLQAELAEEAEARTPAFAKSVTPHGGAGRRDGRHDRALTEPVNEFETPDGRLY